MPGAALRRIAANREAARSLAAREAENAAAYDPHTRAHAPGRPDVHVREPASSAALKPLGGAHELYLILQEGADELRSTAEDAEDQRDEKTSPKDAQGEWQRQNSNQRLWALNSHAFFTAPSCPLKKAVAVELEHCVTSK